MARFDPFSSDIEHPFVNSSPDFGPPRGLSRLRPIGETSSPPAAASLSFRNRRNRLIDLEDDKNQLIDELLSEFEATQKDREHLILLRSREQPANQDIESLETQLKQIEAIVDRDPCITILIDGDHTKFNPDLIKRGDAGGKEAVQTLHKALHDFAAQRLPDIEAPKFNLRMYADLQKLASDLAGSGLIEKSETVTNFVRSFNGTEHQFDIIDTGPNKDCKEQKLIEQLRLVLYNCHCRHVILGGFESETYSDSLEKFGTIPDILMRITLLNVVQPRAELPTWKKKFTTVHNNEVFCYVGNISHTTRPTSTASAIVAPVLSRIESSNTATLRTPTTSAASTPPLTWAGLAAQPAVAPVIQPSVQNSTAMTIMKIPSLAKKSPVIGLIERNRFGQRIDRQDSTLSYQEITKIKRMKLCNTYYLQGPSYCDATNCSHRHDYPISNFERKLLREVARMTPCFYKTECDEPECIYGHRCPQSQPNVTSCYYGADCRFWGWGHGIDMRVVKITKV